MAERKELICWGDCAEYVDGVKHDELMRLLQRDLAEHFVVDIESIRQFPIAVAETWEVIVSGGFSKEMKERKGESKRPQ